MNLLLTAEFWFAFCSAVGYALLHSLWIGLVAGLIYRALTKALKLSSQARYGLAALSLGGFFLAFAVVLAHAILQLDFSQAEVITSVSTFASEFSWQAALSPISAPLALLWFIGVLLAGRNLLSAHRLLQARIARSSSSPWLDALAEPWLARLRLPFRVRLRISDEFLVPCVTGVLRPTVLIPSALLLKLSTAQLELIVLHELVHLKRFDHWLNAGQIGVETLFFFHPAVRWLGQELRHERELCCDDDVLALSGAPLVYARGLLQLEEYRQLPLVMAANGGRFSQRVHRLVGKSPSPARNNRGQIILASLISLALGSFAIHPLLQEPEDGFHKAQALGLISKPKLNANVDLLPILLDQTLAPLTPSSVPLNAVEDISKDFLIEPLNSQVASSEESPLIVQVAPQVRPIKERRSKPKPEPVWAIAKPKPQVLSHVTIAQINKLQRCDRRTGTNVCNLKWQLAKRYTGAPKI